jgi:predicted nucleic acid-binding protein
LSRSSLVAASVLTTLECKRVLVRLAATGKLTAAKARERREFLDNVAQHWVGVRMDADVLERASQPFPVEPQRTLDALHLATALWVRSTVSQLSMLALDQRVRDCAIQLGFQVVP